jgi:hypothetical protein
VGDSDDIDKRLLWLGVIGVVSLYVQQMAGGETKDNNKDIM